MNTPALTVLCGALLLTAGGASAQAANMYKCVGDKGRVVYSERPCSVNAKPMAKKAKPSDARHAEVPQTRAQKANRAALTPEARKECDELAATIASEQAAVAAKGAAATPADEKVIVNSRLKRKQMKCA